MLIPSVLLVWGIIGYQILGCLSGSEDEIIEVSDDSSFNDILSSRKNTLSDSVKIKYISLERDPFRFKKKIRNNDSVKTPQRIMRPPVVVKPLRDKYEQQKPKLNYRINGAVINSSRRLVIFEDLSNNKTMFLKEGEAYNEIIIKEIGKTKVIVVEENEPKEILIQ